jgi:tetratricopeptide (TPR) repeat protein
MKAYEILLDCRNPTNRYKLAQLCMKLNKLDEAEKALLNKKFIQNPRLSNDELENQKHIPNGAAGCYLLGLIHYKKDKEREAVKYFKKALELDPTLWCAFEKLATYDQDLNLDIIFPVGKQISVGHFSRIDQNPPFKQCSSSELFNANLGSAQAHPKDEEISNETKENLKNIVENKAQIYSPIHERDSEDQQDHYTPGSGLNPNYVTPTATGKNSRRMNTIGSNAPQQINHESRLSGISPSGTYKENNESKLLSSHTGDHKIKPFK